MEVFYNDDGKVVGTVDGDFQHWLTRPNKKKFKSVKTTQAVNAESHEVKSGKLVKRKDKPDAAVTSIDVSESLG